MLQIYCYIMYKRMSYRSKVDVILFNKAEINKTACFLSETESRPLINKRYNRIYFLFFLASLAQALAPSFFNFAVASLAACSAAASSAGEANACLKPLISFQ